MKKDFEEILKELENDEIDDEEAQEIYDEIVDMLEGLKKSSMQGYIIDTKTVKDDDLIVTIFMRK